MLGMRAVPPLRGSPEPQLASSSDTSSRPILITPIEPQSLQEPSDEQLMSDTTWQELIAAPDLTSLKDPPQGEQLKIVACQAKGSELRLRRFILQANRLRMWHVICIQDPPDRFPFMQFGRYHRWYNSARGELKDDDDPRCHRGDNPKYDIKLRRVAFLVDCFIPISHWSMHMYPGPNIDLVATLKLQTLSGDLNIHNLYNCDCKTDFAVFVAQRIDGLDSSDGSFDDNVDDNDDGSDDGSDDENGDNSGIAEIIIIDSNSHFILWSMEKDHKGSSKGHAAGVELFRVMQEANWKLLTIPGTITWSRSEDVTKGCSTIDLHIGNLVVCSCFVRWRVVPCPGFTSDHRITETTLLMIPDYTRPLYPRMPDDPDKRIRVREKTKGLFNGFPKPSLDTEAEIESYAALFRSTCQQAIASTIPSSGLQAGQDQDRGQDQARDRDRDTVNDVPEISFCRAQAKIARERSRRLNEPFQAAWERLGRRALQHGIDLEQQQQQQGRRSFLNYVREANDNDVKAFGIAKQTKHWLAPKPPPQMPRIRDSDGNFYTSAAEKTALFREHNFTRTSNLDQVPHKVDSGLPISHELVESQKLGEGEVLKRLRKLKPGRAVSEERIPNDYLILCADILAPHLEPLIAAYCIHSYEPVCIKPERTVLIPKQGKDTYEVVESYRPIALSSVIGKVGQATVAKRITQWAVENGIIPPTQHGSAGKCTTKALQCLVSFVKRGWYLPQRKVSTLMSFDFKSAYTKVPHDLLIETLKDLGMPNWMVRFVASFLSHRRTTLELPGHEVEEGFWVNVRTILSTHSLF